MADIVSPAKRSEMMAGIKSKNTKPEIALRKALFAIGFRYLVRSSSGLQQPDLVFPKYKAAIFIHGCFWHGHSCSLFKMPTTRPEFWQKKIEGNRKIDISSTEKLLGMGWRVGVVWECATRGKKKRNFIEVIEACKNWLTSDADSFEIRSYV